MRRSRASRALRLFTLGAVVLCGQEALLRFLFPLPEVSNFNRARYADPSAPTMHAKWTAASPADGVTSVLSLNLYGFRDRRNWPLRLGPDHRRVIFVGGGLVEGVLVGNKETLTATYAREASRAEGAVAVMNLGLTGGDLKDYLRLLRDVIPLFSPHVAYLVLHAGDLPPPAFDPEWLESPLVPVFPKRWAPRAAHVTMRMVRGERVPFRFWRKPVSFGPLIDRELARIKAGGTPAAARSRLAADLTPALSALERYARRHACSLRVVYLPNAREADPESSPSESSRAFATAQVCRRLGVPFLDLTADLRREQSRGNRLFWDVDPLLRPQGYAAAARGLREWEQQGVKPVRDELGLLPSQAAPMGLVPVESVYRTDHADLDRLQTFFPPTLEANRKRFTGQLGPVSGFGAGEAYPQIWLRDSATILLAARYFYDAEPLRSWIEEHLACQRPDGQLDDWIAAGPVEAFREWAPRARVVFRHGERILSADKNTTETDQEACAVISVHRLFEITGDRGWLRRKILGRSVVERSDRALEFVFQHRTDSHTGLVLSALTADWGDVSPIYGDQRAIYADTETPSGVGLYTNALVCDAAQRLSELWAAAGNAPRSTRWRDRAEALRERINAVLWQDARGFYRMHLPVAGRGAQRLGDDADIFALGGHAAALLANVPDEERANRIFQAEQERRRRHDLAAPGVTLLPPYPDGVFLHPALSRSWQYQNGGHWDWFAGRYIQAEFERGHSRRARAHLEALATTVLRSGGLYEWRTRRGAGRGSRHYAASAAALADAVYRGLFGVYLKGDHLDLRVRPATRSAAIFLRQPANRAFVAYRTDFDATARTVRVRYESSLPGSGTLAVLLPPEARVGEVRRDGESLPFALVAIGEDVFVALSTDWRPHLLEIVLSSTTP